MSKDDDEAQVLGQLKDLLDGIENKTSVASVINLAFKVVSIFFMLTVILIVIARVIS